MSTIDSHRARYNDLRQIAATLVYLRIKLEAEHPEQRDEGRRIADEAERAKRMLAHAGRELRGLERERLRAIAAASTERIERIAGAVQVERELSGEDLADRIQQLEREGVHRNGA